VNLFRGQLKRSNVKVARSDDASDRYWPISRERKGTETPELAESCDKLGYCTRAGECRVGRTITSISSCVQFNCLTDAARGLCSALLIEATVNMTSLTYSPELGDQSSHEFDVLASRIKDAVEAEYLTVDGQQTVSVLEFRYVIFLVVVVVVVIIIITVL